MKIEKITLAFVLSPLFPVAYMLIMPYLSGGAYQGRYDVLLVLLFSLPTSYISCLLLGLPLVRALRKRSALTLVNVVGGGVVLGMIAYYLFSWGFAAFLGSSIELTAQAEVLVWGAILGVMVALPFGLIAGLPLHRPSPQS
ncbi:hypothetical protein [Chitinimonas koreensis]|uniref:hypothetical protein n=1 Tax=Chitinimonas koreensis TaxID=356302 RepID=UPI0012F80CC3|nr:hypothetical protein [Chitinimonas koreensis]